MFGLETRCIPAGLLRGSIEMQSTQCSAWLGEDWRQGPKERKPRPFSFPSLASRAEQGTVGVQ